MIIRNSKFVQLITLLIVLLAEFIAVNFIHAYERSVGSGEALIAASWMCVVVFSALIISWYRLTRELLCPYVIFLSVLFIFTCGQSLGWAFHLDMGSADLWYRVDHGLNHSLLLDGLVYSILGVTMFHIGAVLAYSERATIKPGFDSQNITRACRSLGKLMLVIAVPAFLSMAVMNLTAVSGEGYGGYYEAKSKLGAIGRILNILSTWYLPSLLILLVAYRDNRKLRNLILAAMLGDVIVPLLVGGRSGAVMAVLGMLLAFRYFIRPIQKKEFIIGACAAYLGAALLNAVAAFRGLINRSFMDLVDLTVASLKNAASQLIGELGWTLTSICWSMGLVPGSYPYRYGMSYLVSATACIPSFVFGGKEHHPVIIWDQLGDWLQNALGMSYGPGFTMVAEAYVNFGSFGIVMMGLEGYVVAKFIARTSQKDTENDLLSSIFQILIIMTILKALVRSTVAVAFRDVFLVLAPLYILLRLSINGKKNSITK